MFKKPTYEELEQRIKQLEEEVAKGKRAEEELKRERNIFLGGPVVVFKWLALENWPAEYVSPNVNQFGYQADDIINGKILYIDIIHPEDLGKVMSEVSEYSESGETFYEQEYRIIQADGKERWIYDFTVVHRNDRNEITHYDGYILDNTERKQAEGALRKAHDELELRVEERTEDLLKANERLEEEIEVRKQTEEALQRSQKELQTIVDSVPALIAYKDTNNRYIRINKTYAEATSLPRDAIEGKSAFDIAKNRQVAEAYWRDDKEVMASGIPKRNIIEPMIFDETKICQTDKIPYRDDKGNIVGVIVFCRDITSRVHANEALQESERRYRTLVETMNDGLAVRDENNLIIYANKRFFEMMRYSKDDVIGHQVNDFLDDTNQNILKEQIARRRNGEQAPYEIEWNRKDGKQIPTLMSPALIHDAEGNFKGSFAVITDISTLKKTEQLLKKKEQDLEIKTINLEEINTALRVLLKRREEDKIELEEKVMSNVKQLVKPYLEKLKSTQLDEKQKTFVDILESNLEDLISPFLHRLSSIYSGLTPTEIQVADLVKQGISTKEIGELMNLSWKTIKTHRNHIRAKLKLTNKKSNLRSYLLSIH
ncbi:MAG: PAS domain S-box protein [Deltaproteobacteria bacterium]|nr:PAS domain S-box protein [Deltaproteobacteria bacterium]